MEVVVTISLGVQAGSLALIAFGLDSRRRDLRFDRRDPEPSRRPPRPRRPARPPVAPAHRGRVLGPRRVPDRDAASAAWCAAIGPTARRSASPTWPSRPSSCSASPDSSASPPTELGSEPLQAEAAMTFLDGCLSTGILTALVLNALARLVVDRRRRRAGRRRLRHQRRRRALARVRAPTTKTAVRA